MLLAALFAIILDSTVRTNSTVRTKHEYNWLQHGASAANTTRAALFPSPLNEVNGYAAALLARAPGRKLIVPHISKNGGTAVNVMLTSILPKLNLVGVGSDCKNKIECSRQKLNNDARLKQYQYADVIVVHRDGTENLTRVMLGATTFGQLALLVVIRDPVDRVLSEFLFMRARASSAFVKLPKALSGSGVTWQEWVRHPSESNFQLSFLRGHAMFSHVTTRHDWDVWLECMARTPVALVTMDAINSVVPGMLTRMLPGHAVTQTTPSGRWGQGFGQSGANTTALSCRSIVGSGKYLPLAMAHCLNSIGSLVTSLVWEAKAMPLPNEKEREEVRRLNALDEELYQLARRHTAAYRHLLEDSREELRE